MTDRTVHARYPGMEIVRYDRAGKWYLEPVAAPLRRQQVTLRVAAAQAVWGANNKGGVVLFGRPGGLRFDALVRVRDAARSLEEDQ